MHEHIMTDADQNKADVIKNEILDLCLAHKVSSLVALSASRCAADCFESIIKEQGGEVFEVNGTSDSARRAAEWRDEGGHVWEIRPNVDCVECPHCCFTFAAVHTDGYGNAYSCPNCKGCPDAAALADNDAESVALIIPTCGDCPFVDHSGAFTLGGAKAICGHRNAVETFAAATEGDDRHHWKYRQVDREAAPPAQCPLRSPQTAHVHEYRTIEGQSASECKCGAVYDWPTTKGDR